VTALLGTALFSGVGQTATQAASQRCINTPIGCITEQQNLYLHHHPVLLAKMPAVELAAKFVPEQRVPDYETFFGYFCAQYTGNGSGYGCVNNWNGVKSNGNGIRFYQCPQCGQPGQFKQWYFGTVDNTFPWGTDYNIYTHYQGNSVYQYCWAPGGNGSGYCLDQGNSINGQVWLYQSYTTLNVGDPQFWVWDGNSRFVAVYATFVSYELGHDEAYYAGYEVNWDNGSPVMMEPLSHSIIWTGILG
jgi:hypothetical protein